MCIKTRLITFPLPDVIRAGKLTVFRTEQMINAPEMLNRKLEGNRSLGRPRIRKEDR